MLMKGCGTSEAFRKLNTAMEIMRLDSIFAKQKTQFLTNRVDSLGRHTVEQYQMILSKDQAIALLELENENLRKVNAQVRVQLASVRRDLMIAYRDTGKNIIITNPIDPDSKVPITGKYMKIPRPFAYQDKWLSIFGSVEEEGVKVDSMLNTEKISVTIGRKKLGGFKGFFKPPKPVVKIRSDNPNSHIAAAQNIIVDNRKKGWDNLSLSLYIGYGISVSRNYVPIIRPSFHIGIGVGYRIFPFKRYPI